MSVRSLPSVDAVLGSPETAALLEETPRTLVVDAVRAVLDEHRSRLRESGIEGPSLDIGDIVTGARHWIETSFAPDLPEVINATGVVLHTNLGRAPLSPRAIDSLLHAARAPSAIELDLATGRRGRRDDHVSGLLASLTGAEAGMVVNNNAAALLLIMDTLAHRREVVVSRGELIEIGGSFRLPDVLRRAGAVLREVGTTNRTRIDDYRRVLSRRTALLLRAHPSNYRVEGFTEEASRSELASLGREAGIPFVEDLGSGALIDLEGFGIPHEPTPAEALAAGVDLVTVSGDKLLGGPQAGLIVGRADLIARLQANPLKRALRADKLTLAALRATLTLYRTAPDLPAEVPTLGFLARTTRELEDFAEEAQSLLREALPRDFAFEITESESQIGSGALPTRTQPSVALVVARPHTSPEKVAAFFRSARPAILGRITGGRFLLDVRAVGRPSDLVPRMATEALR
jgi:L-seryl-tRNA(Ser) seleniumtransferase